MSETSIKSQFIIAVAGLMSIAGSVALIKHV